MYYSITFGEGSNIRNTWDDWHLIPTSRPLVSPPEVKTEFVDIVGTDGSLDLTEALSGVNFKDREGEWEFKVANGYQEWNVLYTDILSFINGKNLKIQLESDPGFYYYGRLSVTEWISSESEGFSSVKIKYIVEPFKYRTSTTGSSDWTWDELQFVHYYTIYYGNFVVPSSSDVLRNIINPKNESVTPLITCNRQISAMVYSSYPSNYSTVTLYKGSNSSITLSPGSNYIKFLRNSSGDTSIHIDYDLGATL